MAQTEWKLIFFSFKLAHFNCANKNSATMFLFSRFKVINTYVQKLDQYYVDAYSRRCKVLLAFIVQLHRNQYKLLNVNIWYGYMFQMNFKSIFKKYFLLSMIRDIFLIRYLCFRMLIFTYQPTSQMNNTSLTPLKQIYETATNNLITYESIK